MFQLLIHDLKTQEMFGAFCLLRCKIGHVAAQSSFIYIHSAVDAEELAGLIVQLFQIFSVPVEIWCDEQVGPQVYTVSVRGGWDVAA